MAQSFRWQAEDDDLLFSLLEAYPSLGRAEIAVKFNANCKRRGPERTHKALRKRRGTQTYRWLFQNATFGSNKLTPSDDSLSNDTESESDAKDTSRWSVRVEDTRKRARVVEDDSDSDIEVIEPAKRHEPLAAPSASSSSTSTAVASDRQGLSSTAATPAPPSVKPSPAPPDPAPAPAAAPPALISLRGGISTDELIGYKKRLIKELTDVIDLATGQADGAAE